MKEVVDAVTRGTGCMDRAGEFPVKIELVKCTTWPEVDFGERVLRCRRITREA